MIWQLGPQTFFVTCTYVKRLWDLFIKVLHTLHALKLNFLNKIWELQFVCIPKLIRIDFITCIKYYDHKTFCFCKLIAKDHFLGVSFLFHHWIPRLWERTWPWTFMNKKRTYLWNAHKWKNWIVYRHAYFLWCIIVTKTITICTITSTHVHVRKKSCSL
jgi:hypothetical protein